ncbi:MAG: hypothetical protein CSB28_02305 [Desulfobacterales bacterium]|nr:MAG: hypothetical protein CSB28_02305 [Desulfobacterales bacterium]
MREEDGITTSYLYDRAYRLVAVDGRNGRINYRYDRAGNRIEEERNGQTTLYSYNSANQLLERQGVTPFFV